ncbi:DUF2197 domain-containing protein [Desmospora profundinema]|uniref:Uncharacterized protein YlaI n=1 Tax=Desmospora profundinema TaxID=1571184 RepID=A0ABU1IJ96_9BACL|nr:DUF2197 domain-containing protein [Desmospora profundinema]MDR6224850.1 uncharacterized protein YlaI [Desmospora profundinema]
MKAACILCDQPFTPEPIQQKKLRKHPHRLFLCPACNHRITEQVFARRKEQPKENEPRT